MEILEIKVIGGELNKSHESDLCYDLRAKKITAIEDMYGGKLISTDELHGHPYEHVFNLDFPYHLRSGCRVCVDTGLALEFPENIGAILKPRSGLAYNFGIDVLAGVIDPGYRDTIKVILVNHGRRDFPINENDRIAQLWPVAIHHNYVFTTGEKVSETDRGLNGFGSTGVK